MSAPPSCIRLARADEKSALEALQLRASLALEDYREALTAHPEAVETPLRQFERGHVLVLETRGGVAGFAALEIAAEGEPELDGLFVEPDQWGRGLGARLVAAAEAWRSRKVGGRSAL